ncbi:MAG: hypothetical protein ACOYB3_02090 [Azonexus sp.]
MTPNEAIDRLTEKLGDPELPAEKFTELTDRIKVLQQLQES